MAPENLITVVICDDQAVVREGLEMILNAQAEIEVVGLAQNGMEAVELALAKKPDLVLMDLKMPGMNGILATREIKQQQPETAVLILTTFGEDDLVLDAVRSGAAGYLLKGTPKEELIRAVIGTVAGKSHIDPAVGGKLLDQIAAGGSNGPSSISVELSEREKDVLQLLAKGLTNTQIANTLHLAKGTVRNYLSSIFTKLGVEDRTQAAVLAIRYNIVK